MAKFAIVDVSDISISAQVNLHMASYLWREVVGKHLKDSRASLRFGLEAINISRIG